ncbi:hypothetical protein BCR43DRAFT_483908 [Syncephalastrum racemosum]|uniref:F-box domain-containing protein n=1 Tax=Syncephalastrum racemosum TaxID=13706 RepID=A0A1X2HW24_SYNRA|nr:hypothetical protein BCR43DRAFT_483908 [Syncephalastrum racemosum]
MPFLTFFSSHNRQINASTRLSILSLPNEILHLVLSCLSTPDLLVTCRVAPRFYDLALVIVSVRGCRLRLCFDQESRWRFAVDMTLASVTASQFAFVPLPSEQNCFLYASRVLRRPVLYKILLSEPNHNEDDEERDVLGSSVTVDVRHVGEHSKKLMHGAHFSYNISRRKSSSVKRQGEREIAALEFKCSPVWLCPRRTVLSRMFHAF